MTASAPTAGSSPRVASAPVALRPTTCRMFETPVIERFSRTHFTMPFLFWVPVLSWVGWRSFEAGVSPGVGAVLAAAGFLLWTFTEYVLHRWVFHYLGPKPWQRRFHFIMHGVHHDFPNDPGRLVMPLGVSIPLGAIFYFAFWLAAGAVLAGPLFVGLGAGYLLYDGTHYAVHHFKLEGRWWKFVKRHHMLHHHVGLASRYGVSTPLWDVLFGTMGGPRAGSSEDASAEP